MDKRVDELPPRVLVIDDFYSEPDAVRAEALAARFFQPNPRFPWFVAQEPSRFLLEALRRISERLGEPLFDTHSPSEMSTAGRFALGLEPASQILSVHSDPYMWAGVIYLHPQPPPDSGTAFYRERDTGRCERTPPADRADLSGHEPLDVSYDFARFERVAAVANVYNRLVLYPATLLHAGERFFGTSKHTGRLTQALFFNLGRSYRSAR